MKLERNINGTGRGKYGLIKTRRLAEIDDAAEHQRRNVTGITDMRNQERVRYAISILEDAGVIEWGEPGTEGEFFVIKLRDLHARAALTAYCDDIAKDSPHHDVEYQKDVRQLSFRAGPDSPFCKKPD
jgi:predicted transcriptional regulator